MREISIQNRTFDKLFQRAVANGFSSVPEYLDQLAMDSDPAEFTMTPELGAALDQGLSDLREGRIVSSQAVREDVKRMSREWREEKR